MSSIRLEAGPLSLNAFREACSVHGLNHTFVHEAGHAVAAIDRGLRFASVYVLPPSLRERTNDGEIAGGFDPGPRPRKWTRADPLGTFEVILAGAAAERAVLGHALKNSWLGDIKFWRDHMDLKDALDEQTIGHALGYPFQAVFERVEEWARLRGANVALVAQSMLSGGEDAGKPRRDSRGWELEEDQVRSLVNAHGRRTRGRGSVFRSRSRQ